MSVLQAGNGEGSRQACSIAMDDIRPNPHQPRKEFDDFALMELASSIRQYGLLQPITVRAVEGGYEIVMGERRYRACRMLGHMHIDAFILPASLQDCAVMAIIENIQRENLHYFEEAEAYAQLLEQGLNQEMLARRLSKSASAIANKLRLLKLEPELRQFLWDSGMTERHARALLSLSDPDARSRIAREAAREHLTVKETERLVDRARDRLPGPPPARRIISMVRDHRPYLNAIKNLIDQMKESGMNAQLDLQETEQAVSMYIILPKAPLPAPRPKRAARTNRSNAL